VSPPGFFIPSLDTGLEKAYPHPPLEETLKPEGAYIHVWHTGTNITAREHHKTTTKVIKVDFVLALPINMINQTLLISFVLFPQMGNVLPELLNVR
jgi:hypothetical protein